MAWDPDGLRRAMQRHYPSATVDVWSRDLGADRALHLAMLIVPESQQGVGTGTRIMKDLCEYADAHGALVILSPFTELGVRYRNRLVRWYKRFGFVENKGRRKDFRFRETMYRLPVQS